MMKPWSEKRHCNSPDLLFFPVERNHNAVKPSSQIAGLTLRVDFRPRLILALDGKLNIIRLENWQHLHFNMGIWPLVDSYPSLTVRGNFDVSISMQ